MADIVQSVLRKDVRTYRLITGDEVEQHGVLTAGTTIQPSNPTHQGLYRINGQTTQPLLVEVVVPGDTQYLVSLLDLAEAIEDGEETQTTQ